MKKNSIIFLILVFDVYAFMQGKAYHVSELYKDFYIKHTISAEQYAARVQMQVNVNKNTHICPDSNESIGMDELFLP